MDSDKLTTLTADIVCAHVYNNNIASADVPGLIQTVYTALAATGQEAEAPLEPLTPAVSIRSLVKPDAVACLECGAKMKMLKRHLDTAHNLYPDEYRARWNLGADYPLVAPNYAEKRKQLALKIGLGGNMKNRKMKANSPDKQAPAA